MFWTDQMTPKYSEYEFSYDFRKDSEVYDPEEMWKRALVYWSRAAAQGYSNARLG